MSQTLPSFNPANKETPEGAMQELLAEFSRNFECCMPAIVKSYDRDKHEAVVQPAINMVTTTGEQIERAPVAATVWRFMCGGFLIDLPLSEGDTGWLIASDRESSNVKRTGTAQQPNTYETHKYSNGFFIPDKYGSFSIAAEDDGNMVFQNEAGTEKISIGELGTKITSAALTIDTPLAIFTGDITASGTVTGLTNVIAETKLLAAHTHGTGTVTAATTLNNN